MGDRKNKLQEKNKLAALDKELNELENEYGLLCSRVKELEEDVENTEGDIQNRIEQIDRRTEELMSQNEKIKALDDEKEELKLKLSGEISDDSGEQLNDLMNQLQSEQQYGSRPKNSSEAVMGDLAKMAQLMSRMQLRAESMKKSDNMMMAEEEVLLNEMDSKKSESVVSQVRVWYGHTSCLFKITDNHTFKMLLDEVLTYWSLEPAKNVLVNESNFVWPLNATIREVLGSSPTNTKIKVRNREAEAEAKFSWVSHAAKIESDRKVDEDTEKAEQMVLKLLESEEKETAETVANFLDGDKDIMKSSGNPDIRKEGHLPGMDVSRSVETQQLKAEESVKIHPSQIDIVRYFRLLVFLAFIVLLSNTLFMRRAVFNANMLHRALSQVFFGNFLTARRPERSTVLSQGMSMGTQGITRAKEEETKTVITFRDIDSVDDVWHWLEGPFKAGITGMRNGSAISRLNVSWMPDAKVGMTILRHNTVIGRPRLQQIRSETSGCIKPSKLDVFRAECVTLYDASKNQEMGIVPTSACVGNGKEEYECKVVLDDDAEVAYSVISVDKNGIYTLQNSAGETLTNVPRYRIANSSWPEVAPLSVAYRYSLYEKSTAFTFNSELQKEIDEQNYYSMALSYFADYKGGGFSTDIPLDIDGCDSEIGLLKRYLWLDSRSRALRVTVNTYNPSYDMIAIAEALIEFPPSGGVKPSYSIKTFRATDNWTTEDKSREAIETGLIFLVGVITIDLVYGWFLEFSLPTDEFNLRVKDLYDTEARRKQEKRERRKLKTQEESLSQLSKSLPARIARATIATVTPWKIVDLMILSLFVAQYAVRAGYLSNNQDSLNAKAFDGTKFTDFQQEMLQYKITINIDVVLIFLSTTKTFMFFSYNPNISMIWIILQKSAITFVHSFYVYFVYVSAFTFAGYIVFGIDNDRYIAYDVAYNQVLSMLSGKFDYSEMADTNPWLAPLYYLTVCTFGYLFLKNVFVAIVNDEYHKKANDVRLNGYYWIRTEADFLMEQNRKKQKEIEKYSSKKNMTAGLGQTQSVTVGDNRVN